MCVCVWVGVGGGALPGNKCNSESYCQLIVVLIVIPEGKCDSDDTSSSSENEESTSTDSKKGVVKYRFQIVLIAQHFLSVYCFGQG